MIAAAGANPLARTDDGTTALMAAVGHGLSRSTTRRSRLIAPELVSAQWSDEDLVLETVKARRRRGRRRHVARDDSRGRNRPARGGLATDSRAWSTTWSALGGRSGTGRPRTARRLAICWNSIWRDWRAGIDANRRNRPEPRIGQDTRGSSRRRNDVTLDTRRRGNGGPHRCRAARSARRSLDPAAQHEVGTAEPGAAEARALLNRYLRGLPQPAHADRGTRLRHAGRRAGGDETRPPGST